MPAVTAGLRPLDHHLISRPTTDALKQATERILQDQQAALHAAETYKKKLLEAKGYVERLEAGYVLIAEKNAQLRANAASNHDILSKLSQEFDKNKTALVGLKAEVHRLAAQLLEGQLLGDPCVHRLILLPCRAPLMLPPPP